MNKEKTSTSSPEEVGKKPQSFRIVKCSSNILISLLLHTASDIMMPQIFLLGDSLVWLPYSKGNDQIKLLMFSSVGMVKSCSHFERNCNS